MTTSDSNSVLMSYAREATYANEAPSPAPTLQNLRYTSESLGQDTESTSSNEIIIDRQTSDVKRTNVSTSGDTAHEFSFSDYDDLLESALMDDSGFTAEVVLLNAAAATITASGQTIGATGIHTNAILGEWVLIAGAPTAANNGYFKIMGVATGTLTLARGAAALVDESPTGLTITMLSSIKNGITLDTYLMEKQYTDQTNIFEALIGQAIQQWQLNVDNQGLITQTFSWIGAKALARTATLGDGSNAASGTSDVMSGIDNVVRLLEGSGATADLCCQSFALTLNNNLRPKTKIGTLGAFEVGKGGLQVTGTLVAFFNDAAMIAKYQAFTDTHIATRFVDDDGNTYILDLPRVKYTSGRRVAGGKDQDVMANMGWSAYRDANEDTTIRIVRHSA